MIPIGLIIVNTCTSIDIQSAFGEVNEISENIFLINLEKTSVVNSIGVSILIEIIEKLQESNGKLAYCNLAPIVEKPFNIMGLTKYSTIYSTEEEGLSDLSS